MQRKWDYEPLSIEATTSDASKLSLTTEVERLSRSEFAFTGTIEFNYDIDDTTTIEAVSYRSNTGNEDDYKLLPWKLQKQSAKEFFKGYYEQYIFKNLGHCSNLPQLDNIDPWPKNTYKFEHCVVTGEGMPELVPEGFYKVVFSVDGEVDWVITAVAKITAKTD
ncbi:CG18538, partial [Drosophila busckii]